jgi:hypothetical protein
MKISVIFLCLLVSFSVNCYISYNETSLVVAAINGILTQYHVKNQVSRIEIKFLGKFGSSAETIVDKLVSSLPFELSYSVTTSLTVDYSNAATIFIFDNIELFKSLESWTERQFIGYEGEWHQHIVYAPGLNVELIQEMFVENSGISEVAFLTSYKGSSIELATSHWFTSKKCNDNQIKTINRFSRKTRLWENNNFYPDKFKNFHNCTLDVRYADELTNHIGTMIFNTLAERLNFFMNRINMSAYDLAGVRNEEVLTENVGIQDLLNIEAGVSSAIYFDSMTFVVPPGKPLTDLERMFAAFDDETWIGIGVTFAIAVVVIQIVKFTRDKVKDFVFGSKIRAPMLNLFDIFINGGQNREPDRNFSRFILMLFIIWSLIFRTCYQSMMFENLSSDLRRSRISSIEELKEKGFTLLFEEGDRFRFDYKDDTHYVEVDFSAR